MAIKESNSILLVNDNETLLSSMKEELEQQKYRAITAVSGNEARIKFSNETFKMVIIDHDIKGLAASAFVDSIRRKEEFKNLREHIPILITGLDSKRFQHEFEKFDNVKYLEKPFTPIEFKKKLLTFTGQAKVISENTTMIAKDEYLITEGGVSQEMYWVLSGGFVITKLNHDNQNVIIGTIQPGELVGEMSFLDEEPRSASVKAIEDSEILVIPHKKFIDVLDHQPRWFRSLMKTLSQRLRTSNSKVVKKIVHADEKDKVADED